MVRAVLLHEMIHMFDYCRNKLDVKNIHHLACTEIRAANLAHCSFMGSLFQGDSSFINIKATHQVNYCSKRLHNYCKMYSFLYSYELFLICSIC